MPNNRSVNSPGIMSLNLALLMLKLMTYISYLFTGSVCHAFRRVSQGCRGIMDAAHAVPMMFRSLLACPCLLYYIMQVCSVFCDMRKSSYVVFSQYFSVSLCFEIYIVEFATICIARPPMNCRGMNCSSLPLRPPRGAAALCSTSICSTSKILPNRLHPLLFWHTHVWKRNHDCLIVSRASGKAKGPPPPPRSGRSKPVGRPDTPDIPIARETLGQATKFYSARSWKDCGASDAIISALNAVGVTRPSHIQVEAYRAFASGAPHVVLADHAGSGKTLAYLLPLLQSLKAEEEILGGPSTLPKQPKFVIVAPTAELCSQVLRVSKALSSQLRFRSIVVTGGRPIRTQKEALAAGVDVLIGTPGRLLELINDGAFVMDRCSALVYDEVDVLIGPHSLFIDQVAPLRNAAPTTTRCVLVTATLPADVHTQLEPLFPGIVGAFGPGLHRTAPGVREQIVDCSGGDEVSEESGIQRKLTGLLASLQECRATRTIVFCNKIESCRRVENFLNKSLASKEEIIVLPYHSAIAPHTREANLRRFLSVPSPQQSENNLEQEQNSGDGRKSEARLVLVCTDRASRGVDSAYVDHVVLFDFPRDPSEYLRRVGRTGRGASGGGLVTVLVLGRQVKLAQDISGRNEKGLPVHSLPVIMPASTRISDADRFAADLRKARSDKTS